VDLRDSTQQVLDREVWNNHLVLLHSRHAIPRTNTHSDYDRRERVSGLSYHSSEKKEESERKGGEERE
jgi:hypothetical protein